MIKHTDIPWVIGIILNTAYIILHHKHKSYILILLFPIPWIFAENDAKGYTTKILIKTNQLDC